MAVAVNLDCCAFYAKIRTWPYLGRITGLNRIITTDANLVVTQPTIKIEIWSRKAEIGLIWVRHNGNLPQGTNTIGMSRMTPRSQLIFDKSDSVRSRTEECKNHSHTLKLKNSEVIIIKAAEIVAYMSLNSSWKLNPNGPLMWTYMRSTQNWPKTLNWKAHNLIQTSLGSQLKTNYQLSPNMKENNKNK